MTQNAPATKPGEAFERLCQIMGRLRGPDGCPWDAEQTPESLKNYIIEECYEVLEAIDLQRPDLICEELGDLLLQVVFQARIFQERGDFDAAAVAEGIADKLIRRHPHVFADQPQGDPQTLHRRWEAIKREEKIERGTLPARYLDGIPMALPALQRSEKLSGRAARAGFDWPDLSGPRDKISEETAELDQALAGGNRDEIEHELGDLLFAIANFGRHLGISAEEALRQANRRFTGRYHLMEDTITADESELSSLGTEDKLAYWNRAKIAMQSKKN